MQSAYLSVGKSTFHYYRFGVGAKWLFCFHGYGEDGRSFGFLEKQLGKQFTIIALEMPFHGKTEWNESLLLEPELLVELIHRIKAPQIPMQLLGYSMGGRICLQLMHLIPSEIEQVILIAPDGLHKNIWQKISTQTLAGNKLFHFTMRNPGWMIAMMDLLGKAKLFNPSIRKFVHYYLDEAAARDILFKRWTTMRRFKPRKKELAAISLEKKIPVSMLFGKYDKVITDRHGKKFAAMAPALISLQTIEAGHQLLKQKYATLIAEMILKQ
ncbi:MAG: alpha/beta hydrolase [Chitinophagaceae bacterium]|nr:alpha/beta hydrolase [Chitinophagaceae bacterium]